MKRLLLVTALVYAHAAGASAPAKAHPQDRAQDPPAATAKAPRNIGSATMLEDGTIVLALIYWFPDGSHTTPTDLRYKPDHPEYGDLVRHLGGMQAGQVKGVKPWPGADDVPVPDFDAIFDRMDLKEFKEVEWPENPRTDK